MRNRVKAIRVVRYPILHVTFADGFCGEFDAGPDIASLEMFGPLKDEALFSRVNTDGDRVGWRLDETGNEIDYASETVRNIIETAAVKELAEAHRLKLHAAE